MRPAGAEKVRPALFASLPCSNSSIIVQPLLKKQKDIIQPYIYHLDRKNDETADLQQPYIQANETMQEMTGKSVLTVAG